MTCLNASSAGVDGFQWQHHFVPSSPKNPCCYILFFFYDNPLFIYFQLQTLNNNCSTDFETKSPRRTSNTYPLSLISTLFSASAYLGQAELNPSLPQKISSHQTRGKKKCYANSTVGRRLTAFQQEAPSLNYTSPAFKTKILLSPLRFAADVLLSPVAPSGFPRRIVKPQSPVIPFFLFFFCESQHCVTTTL